MWNYCHLGSKSRPLQGPRAGARASRKDAFPLNKYVTVYPAALQPVNAPRRLRKPSTDRPVLPFLPVSIPTVSAVSSGGQQSLSGPVVIVRGAAGG